MSDYEESKKSRKSQFFWKPEDEKKIVSICKAVMPYNKGHGRIGPAWDNVEVQMNTYLAQTNRSVTLPSIKLKMDALLKKMSELESSASNSSGIIELNPFLQKDLLDINEQIESSQRYLLCF
jgi:hypothetical protein